MKTTPAENLSSSDKLARLAQGASERHHPLDAFDAPAGLCEVHLEVEHMTSLCPATGAEDFYSVDVRYAPRGRCLETKSLKEYLASFRATAVSAEVLADQLAHALLEASGAQWMRVTLHQAVRGGIRIHATAHLSLDEGDSLDEVDLRPLPERSG